MTNKKKVHTSHSGGENNRDQKDNALSTDELTEALARAMADLQNFKRRNKDEKNNFIKFANARFLNELIPIFDNLDRSVQLLPKELADNEWAKGILQIQAGLSKALENLGVKKIKTVGEPLDPGKHEALMTGPGKKDIITEEFEPGYTLADETVKAAKVKVGNGLSESGETNS